MSDHITVTGRVATAPKRIGRGEGPTLVTFRLASNDSRFDSASGKWVESGTNWYSINAWRSLGDNVDQSLQVGEQVVVRGRLDLRTWRDDNGKDRVEPTIQADALGHDLRRGVTRLIASSSPQSAGGAEGTHAESRGEAESEQWAVEPHEAASTDLPF